MHHSDVRPETTLETEVLVTVFPGTFERSFSVVLGHVVVDVVFVSECLSAVVTFEQSGSQTRPRVFLQGFVIFETFVAVFAQKFEVIQFVSFLIVIVILLRVFFVLFIHEQFDSEYFACVEKLLHEVIGEGHLAGVNEFDDVDQDVLLHVQPNPDAVAIVEIIGEH